MTRAFCPGHITCFFQPVRSYDLMSMGSRGVGIRLSKGSHVTVEERTDQRIEVTIDGEQDDANITRIAMRMLAPERGFDVTVENELPISQGFGMSAAGAISAALCVCSIVGKKKHEAYRTAHLAEIQGGGGLGDVAALMSPYHIPIRTTAGIPPLGKVVSGGPPISLTVATLGPSIRTSEVLNDKATVDKITVAGSDALSAYVENPTVNNLFKQSRNFSGSSGIETNDVFNAFVSLGKRPAAMCMLGNSIFTTADADTVADTLDADFIGTCCSTDAEPKLIRKA